MRHAVNLCFSSALLGITLIALLAGLSIAAETEDPIKICGEITKNTTWKASQSPIIVTCPSTVTAGVALTIEAGVQVRFKKASRKGRPGMLIDGQLIAKGTEGKPIIFTSDARKPFQGDWSSIRFTKSSIPTQFDAKGNYVGGSIFEFAVIEMGGGAGKMGVIEVRNTALLLNNVVIHKNAASGVRVKNASVTILNSLLQSNSNSQAFGSGVLAHSATVTIKNTDIIDNHVAGQGAGVFAHDSTVSVADVRFIGNRSDANGG